MKTLKIIKDSDVGSDISSPNKFEERRASRAIVFDSDNNIALLDASKAGYHKLPGGGIEEGEEIQQALRREMQEEIGCDITDIRELGVIEEYRNKFALHQTSYCFIAKLSGNKGTPHLEPGEIADGFMPIWLSIESAIEILEAESGIERYEGKFIRLRDLIFLKEAKNFLSTLT